MALNNLVDIHAHLDSQAFSSDLPEVIERARKKGVCTIINNGLDHNSNQKTLEISKRYSIVRCAFGLHPTNVGKTSDENIGAVLNFIEQHAEDCTGVGEIGLDYKYSADIKEKEKQKLIFLQMLDTAKKLKKPVIVHSRMAESDVIDILEKQGLKRVVLHAFTGNLNLVKQAVKNGWHFSVPPKIVRSTHFQQIVRSVPLSHILTETDSPYLGIRRERNEPMFVAETISEIARIKEMTPEDAANSIYMNFQRIFCID